MRAGIGILLTAMALATASGSAVAGGRLEPAMLLLKLVTREAATTGKIATTTLSKTVPATGKTIGGLGAGCVAFSRMAVPKPSDGEAAKAEFQLAAIKCRAERSQQASPTIAGAANEKSSVATMAALASLPLASRGWKHNSSAMSLDANGDKVSLLYELPRQGLADLKIVPGTILVVGTRSGDKIEGTAKTFSRRCGAKEYPVNGDISKDVTIIVLTGKAPVMDAECKVSGTRDERLEFERR